MPSKTVTILLVALLTAGCSDDPQPTRRTVADPAGSEDPHGGTGDPHGGMSSPHGGMPGQMPRPMATGPYVIVGSMVMTAPEGWQRKQPRSPQITMAEFGLPAAEGDTAGGRLTISQVRGSVDELRAYWQRQFTGSPIEAPQETKEVSGVSVVLVGMSGAFRGQSHGANTVTGNAGYRMRVAIFNVDGRQYVVKCVGPEKTMADSEDALMAFIESLKRPGPPSTKGGPAKPESPAAATPKPTDPVVTDPEAPRPEVPAPEVPESEAPESEEPESEEPESEEPESEEPESEEPESEEPESEEPESEGPESEEPESEEPGTEAPGTDAPGTDAPGTDAPGTDAPAPDAPAPDAPERDATESGSSEGETPVAETPAPEAP